MCMWRGIASSLTQRSRDGVKGIGLCPNDVAQLGDLPLKLAHRFDEHRHLMRRRIAA